LFGAMVRHHVVREVVHEVMEELGWKETDHETVRVRAAAVAVSALLGLSIALTNCLATAGLAAGVAGHDGERARGDATATVPAHQPLPRHA
jgi:hypothetical protein